MNEVVSTIGEYEVDAEASATLIRDYENIVFLALLYLVIS
jgi:hypothetical protein